MHSTRPSRTHAGLALATVFFGVSAIHAQIAFNGTTAYTQNFDALPSSGAFTFVNDVTLSGWYSSVESGLASNGAASGDAPIASSGSRTYSWGTIAGSDRALGIFNRTSTPFTGHVGIQLQNTSGGAIDAITLTFDVEQWRRNTGGATLGFSYLTTSSSDGQLTAGGYTTDARGGLSAFATAGSGTGTDGNSTTFRQTVSFTLSGLDWQNGDYLWLRWTTSDSVSTAAGIGIDNLTVAVASTIPEPSSAAFLLGTGGLLAATASRRRR